MRVLAFAPGSRVRVGHPDGPVEAVVVAVTYFGREGVEYDVAWWNSDHDRCHATVCEHELHDSPQAPEPNQSVVAITPQE